jgi:hypothetical protein
MKSYCESPAGQIVPAGKGAAALATGGVSVKGSMCESTQTAVMRRSHLNLGGPVCGSCHDSGNPCFKENSTFVLHICFYKS